MKDFSYQTFAGIASLIVVLEGLMIFVLFVMTVGRRNSVRRFFGIGAGRQEVKFVLSNIHLKDVPEASIAVAAVEGSPVRTGYTGNALSHPDVTAMLLIKDKLETVPSAIEAVLEWVPNGRLKEYVEHVAKKLLSPRSSFEPAPAAYGRQLPKLPAANAVLIGSSVYNAYTQKFLRACGFAFSFHPSIEDPFVRARATSERLAPALKKIRWLERIDHGAPKPLRLSDSAPDTEYTHDLGVLARLQLDSGHVIVICAGNDAQSTIGCAKYLTAHIQDLDRNYKDVSFVRVLGFRVDPDELRRGRKVVSDCDPLEVQTLRVDKLKLSVPAEAQPADAAESSEAPSLGA